MIKLIKNNRLLLISAISMVLVSACSTRSHFGIPQPQKAVVAQSYGVIQPPNMFAPSYDNLDRERYSLIVENDFRTAAVEPLSTFSIDVDTASYSNVRRYIHGGQLPPVDAVRIEELVNYFNYQYPEPDGQIPFSISTEVAQSPWNENRKLMQIGLKAKGLDDENLPPSNLVFLIDVSGSMAGRLPLVKSALKLLVHQLKHEDRIAIAVYAGAAGLVLPSTAGSQKEEILSVLDSLHAGGSTAGGAGINLAYTVALENFKSGGNNRVILATDGDFNVGPSSESDLYRLIEQKRKQGIALTVLGFGRGNINDSTMELLADKGNGNYAYIDSLLEAKKVLINEMGGTLFTIAKDVKIQVEFNPARVKSYRLIGYENRLLQTEDFANDKKDAGEIGAGHTVTALYEIITASANDRSISNSIYVNKSLNSTASNSNELATVKLRYKQPKAEQSLFVQRKVLDSSIPIMQASENLRFASAVAEFGMLLRKSKYVGQENYPRLIARARGAVGSDNNGYRSEFVQLVSSVEAMQ